MVKLVEDLASITVKDIISAVVVAILLAVVLKVFVLGAFMIPSHSMENTLLPGDYILVNKLAYIASEIHRGDVIVFDSPTEIPSLHGDLLIKRVVGIPGDTLTLTRDDIFYNGNRLPTPPGSSHQSPVSLPSQPNSTIVIPTGFVYVVGDNRANSYDSRYWGLLNTRNVRGAPVCIYWSRGTDTTSGDTHVRWNRIFSTVN